MAVRSLVHAGEVWRAGDANRDQRLGRTAVSTFCVAAIAVALTWVFAAWPAPAWSAVDGEGAHALDLVRRQPLRAEGFVELAAWLFHQGDIARAVAAAREATRLEPEVAGHYRLLGYLCAALGAERDAEAAFERAAELDPSVRTPLADFRLAQAWAEYEEVLRLGVPNAAVEERLRGIAALAAGTPELETLLRSPWSSKPQAAEFVPPVALGDTAQYALVVEKRSQTVRLYTRDGSDLFLLQTYPCTTGQEPGPKWRRGDRRTPDGVYVVTDLRAGDRLPGIYGALAMTLSYPNAWDRRQGRDGYGIWLHGSDRLNAPFTQRDTRGCILMRNEDLSQLAQIIAPGVTPVLIAEEVPYRRASDWHTIVQQLVEQFPVTGLLAVVATPDYAVVMHRDGTDVVRDFMQPQPWHVAASEKAPLLEGDAWKQQLAEVLPGATAAVVHVGVHEGEQDPSVVIETSERVQARGFRPDSGDRLYVDLPGVRPGPMPSTVSGEGPWVKEVRVAATNFDPPITRVVIELRQPSSYRIASEGNRIVVSLGHK
ncbi:MAG: L,D-transpeptidase family protein [Candidatus Binatia bacterium]